MGLPISTLAASSVTVAGVEVPIRSLSRAEALKLGDFKGREEEAEVFILMAGTGCTDADAKAFREGNDALTAGSLIDGILILSGLATDSPKT